MTVPTGTIANVSDTAIWVAYWKFLPKLYPARMRANFKRFSGYALLKRAP